jgi:hypothetical protein
MTHLGPPAELSVQDISVDREGRVTITNPRIGGRVYATAKRPKPPQMPPNSNCQCNTVKGCAPINEKCFPPSNTTPNCGCTIARTT